MARITGIVILNIPMQFKNFLAWPLSRSLVYCESMQNHRVCVFQRNSRFILLLLVNFGTILEQISRRGKSVQ